MSELQERLEVMTGKWIARAKELEAEAEAEQFGNSKNADVMTSIIDSKNTIARMYRACANEVAKEAGFNIKERI